MFAHTHTPDMITAGMAVAVALERRLLLLLWLETESFRFLCTPGLG